MGRHGTIAGRKEKQDSKRSQVFTKHARAIMVAAKKGGDPEYNFSLKHAIDKAKAINMPNDNIERAIKKGTGELDGDHFEEGRFEGYAPGGVAVIVEVLTDNKNRSTPAIKHAFDKNGGNLGAPGCVSYMFERKGVIAVAATESIGEEDIMDVAIEAGAQNIESEENEITVITSGEDFAAVKEAIQKVGASIVEADIEYLPNIYATPTDDDKKALEKLVDMLEDNDDVQKVYYN